MAKYLLICLAILTLVVFSGCSKRTIHWGYAGGIDRCFGGGPHYNDWPIGHSPIPTQRLREAYPPEFSYSGF